MIKGSPDWIKGVKLLGVDEDGNIVTVLLDGSGAMVAILKGKYDETHKTLALTEDGRIIASIEDPANVWGHAIRIGLTELAARMGIPDLYERRGDIVWYDGFESGVVGWDTAALGTGAQIIVSAEATYQKDYSCKLIGGSDGERTAQIDGRVAVLSTSARTGVQVALNHSSNVYALSLELTIYHTDKSYTGKIVYHHDDQDLQYIDSEGNEQTLGEPYGLNSWGYLFNLWKLVINPDTGMYERLYLNDDLFDLTAYALDEGVYIGATGVKIVIKVVSRDGVNSYTFVDDVMITTNEPPT